MRGVVKRSFALCVVLVALSGCGGSSGLSACAGWQSHVRAAERQAWSQALSFARGYQQSHGAGTPLHELAHDSYELGVLSVPAQRPVACSMPHLY